MVARGDSIYHGQVAKGTCMNCHGADAKGVTGIAPSLADAEWLTGDGSYEFIIGRITAGGRPSSRYNGTMLPRGGAPLSDDDVKAVAAYVYSISHQ